MFTSRTPGSGVRVKRCRRWSVGGAIALDQHRQAQGLRCGFHRRDQIQVIFEIPQGRHEHIQPPIARFDAESGANHRRGCAVVQQLALAQGLFRNARRFESRPNNPGLLRSCADSVRSVAPGTWPSRSSAGGRRSPLGSFRGQGRARGKRIEFDNRLGLFGSNPRQGVQGQAVAHGGVARDEIEVFAAEKPVAAHPSVAAVPICRRKGKA